MVMFMIKPKHPSNLDLEGKGLGGADDKGTMGIHPSKPEHFIGVQRVDQETQVPTAFP